MVKNADALLNVKEYPHVDSYEVGLKAMNLIYQMINKKLKPKMEFYKLPLMAPLSSSYLSPVKDINEYCKEFEEVPGVIDCSFVHGFPYSDISESGSSIIVITNESLSLAEEISTKVADFVMKKKESFFPKILTPIEGVKKALDYTDGPIIINETSDNPGGGASGNSTYLLQAMIEAKATNSCLGTIFDLDVIQEAVKAGVGKKIDIKIGSKNLSDYGDPLKVTAYVKSITDGQFIQSSPMWEGLQINMGTSVRLVIHGIDVIVCSKRSQVFDDQIFKLHGINVEEYKLVGVKSSNHFRAHFDKISKGTITVNAPGLSRFDFENFDYLNASPMNYPLSLNS